MSIKSSTQHPLPSPVRQSQGALRAPSTQHPAPATLTPERSPSAARRVLAALSGGVDSAVAAALLVEAGYEVIAISMLLAGNAEGHEGSCCSIDDFQDARRVADHLGIPYYVLNLREAF